MALIELPEQDELRLVMPIVNIPADTVEIGMYVQLVWTDYKGFPIPAFAPAEAHAPTEAK